MTSLDLNQQPLCIEYPTLDIDFELKSGLIHLLPTFRGLAGSIVSWNELKKQFLENYFPASRTITIQTEISGIRQFFGESFYEYWGRFKHLVESCPHHQISDHLLIQHFYEGLSETNRSLMDAASRGALYDKTPTKARKLITTMAVNKQQFCNRNDNPPRKVNEVSASIDERLDELTSLVKIFVVGGPQQVKTCEICTSRGHFTDACPTLHEEPTEHINVVGGYSGPSQRGYDPFFKTYNPGWRDHPNLRYDNQSQNFQKPPPPPQSNPNSGMSLEDMMQTLISNTQQFQQDTRTSIQNLENQTRASIQNLKSQVSQLASSVSRLESRVGEEHPKVFVPKPPVSKRFAKSKKEDEEKEILETLCKVEVNIPLLNAIKQVPRYAKFLKEMCTNKSKLRENAMCDLGASINVMSLVIYESLNIGPLKETGVVLQLADRSIVYPDGVLEDVLVQVNELVFPTNFYVLDMIGDNSPNSTSILLGRPFLKTSKIKIDVDAEILSMEFDNEVVSFYIDGVT
ncbi:UNVERIFIED_CONTAM: hypothetical protein Slati_0090400 [Sesamum latifolium]|uniref:Retrotransposon gag domain-containing protein n=1 Tax=Sesamum latifolium TaxID=2727402 RepID=A0AAW2Y892_9LAMI